MVFSLYEVQWVMSYGVVELLASWPVDLVDLIEIWNPPILHKQHQSTIFKFHFMRLSIAKIPPIFF